MRLLEKHTRKLCLYVFDFDGVLSPHVPFRGKAYPRKSTLALLEELNRMGTVAVVSGRSVADLKARLGFRPKFTVGNHGLEGLVEFRRQLRLARKATQSWRKQLKRELNEIDETVMEYKNVSLTIHYHFAKNTQKTKRAILDAVAKLDPKPRVVLGKKVVNLVLPSSANKGQAVLALLKSTKIPVATYVGDDVTDEDVFKLRDSRVFSVRVGRKNTSAAGYFIPAQRDIDRFLRLLIRSQG